MKKKKKRRSTDLDLKVHATPELGDDFVEEGGVGRVVGGGADLVLAPVDLDEGVGEDLGRLDVDGVVVGGDVEVVADAHERVVEEQDGEDVEGADEEEGEDDVPEGREGHSDKVITLDVRRARTDGHAKELALEDSQTVSELVDDNLAGVLVGEEEVEERGIVLLVPVLGGHGRAVVLAEEQLSVDDVGVEQVDSSVAVVTVAVVLDPLPLVPEHPAAPEGAEVVEDGERGEGVVARVVHEVEADHLGEDATEDGPPDVARGERLGPAEHVEHHHDSELDPLPPSGLVRGAIKVLLHALLQRRVEAVLLPEKVVVVDVLRKTKRVVDGRLDLVLFEHLVDGLVGDGVERLEELSAITSLAEHEDVLAAWVVLGELGEVVALSVDEPQTLGVKVELGEQLLCGVGHLLVALVAPWLRHHEILSRHRRRH